MAPSSCARRRGDPSWHTDPLEYRLPRAARRSRRRGHAAPREYRGGTLDWYHFRRVAGRRPARRDGQADQPRPQRPAGAAALPRDAGRPVLGDRGRDRLVRRPRGRARRTSCARSSAASPPSTSDDWLVGAVPPAGRQPRPGRSLDGARRLRRAARHPRRRRASTGPSRVWRFFELEDDPGPTPPSRRSPAAPLLLVAPALPDTEQGPPLERVDMIRDEVANLAWAIERRALAASGASVRPRRRRTAPRPGRRRRAGRYVAYTPVPEHWIPLVPVRGEDEAAGPPASRAGRRPAARRAGGAAAPDGPAPRRDARRCGSTRKRSRTPASASTAATSGPAARTGGSTCGSAGGCAPAPGRRPRSSPPTACSDPRSDSAPRARPPGMPTGGSCAPTDSVRRRARRAGRRRRRLRRPRARSNSDKGWGEFPAAATFAGRGRAARLADPDRRGRRGHEGVPGRQPGRRRLPCGECVDRRRGPARDRGAPAQPRAARPAPRGRHRPRRCSTAYAPPTASRPGSTPISP